MATSNAGTNNISTFDRQSSEDLDLLSMISKHIKSDKKDIFDNNRILIDNISQVAEMAEINNVLNKAEIL